jgi:hypothetical protein
MCTDTIIITLLSSVTLNFGLFLLHCLKIKQKYALIVSSYMQWVCDFCTNFCITVSFKMLCLTPRYDAVRKRNKKLVCNLSVKLFLDGYKSWLRMGVDSLEPRVLATSENSSIQFPSSKLWYSIIYLCNRNILVMFLFWTIALSFCLNV